VDRVHVQLAQLRRAEARPGGTGARSDDEDDEASGCHRGLDGAITKHSWLDEDTKIRVYIPIEDGRFQQPGIIEPSQAALRDSPGRQPFMASIVSSFNTTAALPK
jgi:hypothetical protein